MDIKLEVIRMLNEDVITTSCDSVWGVARITYDIDKYNIDGYQNWTNNDNKNDKNRECLKARESVEDKFTGNGFYHIESDGTIIEKCPYNNIVDVFNHHHIDLSN